MHRTRHHESFRSLVNVAVVSVCLLVGVAIVAGPAAGQAGPDPVRAGMAGNGSVDDPYVITNATELQAMSANLSAHYVLGNDVDASETATWNNGSGFVPVGDVFDPFAGTFDGRGYEIADLSIDRGDDERVALFGGVGPNGTVTDVHLRNVSVVGDRSVGSLVGHNQGRVANASASGTVVGDVTVGGLVANSGVANATVENASTSVTVTGDNHAGGLLGRNAGTVVDATASGDVTVDTWGGGLVADNGGVVENASASGSVTAVDPDAFEGIVGGLVAENDGTIANASASGDVAGSYRVGGLVGENVEGGSVANARSTGDVTGNRSVGGLVGFNEGGWVNESYAAGTVTATGPAVNVSGLVGRNDGLVTDAYWDVNGTGQVTSDGGTGLATAEMTGAAALTNATGLDYADAWTATDGYPRLRWTVQDVTVDVSPARLGVGDTAQATPTLSLADGSTVTAVETADYDSVDPSVVTVDDGGTVEGIAPGTASIQATLVASGSADVDVLESYTVSGTITDGVLNEPVENATVRYEAFDGVTANVTTTTNATGYYEVSLLDWSYHGTATASRDGRSLRAEWVAEIGNSDLAGVDFSLWDVMARSGTAEDPFVVTDRYELQSIQANRSAHYVLGNEIDASQTATWNGGDGFDPIGGWDSFTGSLDGRGHTVNGLTIDRSEDTSVGLFEENRGEISNVTLSNVSVAGDDDVGGLAGRNAGAVSGSSVSGTVSGDSAIGGLVGSNEGGTVTTSTSSANVEGFNRIGGLVGANDGDALIANASGSGPVTGSLAAGGLTGANHGAVRDSTANGDVTGDGPGWQVGGLVGQNEGAIERSTASGDVTGEQRVGGLVGRNQEGTVRDGAASGDVVATQGNVGGLVGVNTGPDGTESVVERSWASGRVEGEFGVGGLVGDNRDAARVESSFATGAVAGNESVGGLVGSTRRVSAGDPVVTTSYATGNVTGTDGAGGLIGNNSAGLVEESYATGTVTGGGGAAHVGGLVGANTATVTEGYWDGSATGQSTSAGSPDASGLPTDEMTGGAAETSLTGFDFDGNWTTTDGYPRLRWAVQDLTLDLDEATLEFDETTAATVTLALADGTTVTATDTATYASDDASVATVADGVVSAHESGTATLEAEHAGFADTASLDVAVADDGGGGGGGALDPPGTPAIGVDSVTIGDDALAPGESTTITVTLANDGDGDGTHEVVLLVDGDAVDATDVFVSAGGTQTVEFAHRLDDPGEYAIAVDEVDAGTVTVREAQNGKSPTVTGDPTGTGTSSDRSTNSEDGDASTPNDNGGAPEPDGDRGGPELLAGLVVVTGAIAVVAGLGVLARARE